MSTIYDIARQTGYSAPTVSKALNGHPDIGKTATAEILRAASELGYIPNQSAKSLKTRKSWLVGVLFEEGGLDAGLEHPLFPGILDAFRSGMEASGHEILFLARNLGGRRMSLLGHCRYRALDGVLILDADGHEPGVQELAGSGIPCVSSNIILPGVPSVTSENQASAAEAVRSLYSLGHRRIAHIAGPQDAFATAGSERLEGYRRGLASCGLDFDPGLVVEARQWSMHAGYEAMIALLTGSKERGAMPTAIFVAADILVFGAMRACRELGIGIPDDLSVIGFDDSEWTAIERPSISTFRQDRAAIGALSAALLLDRISGKIVPGRITVPATFIMRGSCRKICTVGGLES